MNPSGASENRAPTTYEVEAWVRVRITVGDPEYVLRCVDNIDGWRDKFYDIEEPGEVFAHLAFNAIFNGVEDADRLDGWADLEPGDLTMTVVRGVEHADEWPRFLRPDETSVSSTSSRPDEATA